MIQATLKNFDSVYFEGEILKAHLPALDGELTILSNHAPLLTILRPGLLRLVLPEPHNIQAFSITSGFAQVSQTHLEMTVQEACPFQEEQPFPFQTEPLLFEEFLL